MGTKKSVLCILGNFGIVLVLTACAVTGVFNSDQASLRLEDGAVQVQDENGDWVPLANNASFEIVGVLENTNPWTVAGKTLQTNESTQIAEGLQTGDLVRVRGTILEDDSWLTYSIERVEEQENHTIILIGVVTSVDPWVVNGITLNLTDDTVISGDISPGMFVRVEILLLEDGTWEVISITPLGNFPPTSGCVTVIATVVSVNGNEIQFLGWPTTVTLQNNTQTENNQNNDENNDEENEGEAENNDEGNGGGAISPGQTVLAVVCVSENGQLVIAQITILSTDEDNDASGGEKVTICHKASKNPHTITVASSAVPAHLAHGDTLGPCP